MRYFLGIFPDRESIKKIQVVKEGVQPVFDDFGIPVRWSKGDKYHLSVAFIGNDLPFYKTFFLKKRLKTFSFERFSIRFSSVKLGISRKYKELLYLDILEGGEEMRKLFLSLTKLLSIKEEGNFIPHLTLGRVSKDLTDQEFLNISRDLNIVSKKIGVRDIRFDVIDISLVKSNDGEYQLLMKLRETPSNFS